MAGKGAVLAVQIVSDASGAKKGFSEAEQATASFTDRLDKASLAAAGVLTGIAAIAHEAYEAASAAQQSAGAVESVFGAQAAGVKALAAEAAEAVGLSKNSYQELAAVLGAQLKNMGTSQDQLAGQTDELIRLGSDMAATFGGTTADAVAALSSLLRGERDPIERYGVGIKAADVEARLAAQGLDDLTGAARTQAEATATLALLTQQTASVQGAHNRELDTAAGAAQTAAAKYDDAKAALGEALLPVMVTAMELFSGFTDLLTGNEAAVQGVVLVVAGLAAMVLAVNAALRVYAAVSAIATAAQWLLNVALTANPIGIVVVAVAALAAGIAFAATKVEWLRDLLSDAWDWIQRVWGKLGGFLTGGGADGFGWSAADPGGAAVAGVFGAAPEPAADYGPLYGAPLSAPAGGGSTAGRGLDVAPSTTINITVTGALDPVAVGRQLRRMLADTESLAGRVVAVTRR
jgi:hypothetical protein